MPTFSSPRTTVTAIVLLAVRPATCPAPCTESSRSPSGAVVVIVTSRPVERAPSTVARSNPAWRRASDVNGSPFGSNAGTRFTIGTPTSAAKVSARATGARVRRVRGGDDDRDRPAGLLTGGVGHRVGKRVGAAVAVARGGDGDVAPGNRHGPDGGGERRWCSLSGRQRIAVGVERRHAGHDVSCLAIVEMFMLPQLVAGRAGAGGRRGGPWRRSS